MDKKVRNKRGVTYHVGRVGDLDVGEPSSGLPRSSVFPVNFPVEGRDILKYK